MAEGRELVAPTRDSPELGDGITGPHTKSSVKVKEWTITWKVVMSNNLR